MDVLPMTEMIRQSPVIFDAEEEGTEMRSGWQVVRAYRGEADDSGLSDLSHWTKWDLQDRDLSRIPLEDIVLPESPGDVSVQSSRILLRLNRTQAVVWHTGNSTDAWPDHPAVTDVTDAYCLLGLFGPSTGRIMEKITALDLRPGGKTLPMLLQGPVLHIPMLVVVVDDRPAVLMACARGYGQTVADAVRTAGAEFGLKPAGEQSALRCLEQLIR